MCELMNPKTEILTKDKIVWKVFAKTSNPPGFAPVCRDLRGQLYHSYCKWPIKIDDRKPYEFPINIDDDIFGIMSFGVMSFTTRKDARDWKKYISGFPAYLQTKFSIQKCVIPKGEKITSGEAEECLPVNISKKLDLFRKEK